MIHSKKVQMFAQAAIAQAAADNPSIKNEERNWKGELNGVLKPDDKYAWFSLAPLLFSGTKKSDSGPEQPDQDTGEWFALSDADRNDRTHYLPDLLPDGAIDPLVLKIPAAKASSYGYTLLDGPRLPNPAASKPRIIIFRTLADLDRHLINAFGEPVPAEQLRTTTFWQRGTEKLQGMTFWPSKSENNAQIVRYKNAFGDTVVELSSEDIFDAVGKKVGKSYDAVAHLTGEKKLPDGKYAQYIVRYYFEPNGDYRGLTIDRATIHYRQRGPAIGRDYIERSRIATIDHPGHPIPAAIADMFIKELWATRPAVASTYPAGGPETQLKAAVLASLRNWFGMMPRQRHWINDFIDSRRMPSPLKSQDMDRIEPAWITFQATAHLEKRGGTLFDIKKTETGLEVTNAGIIFADPGIFSLYTVFGFGNAIDDFPPEPLIEAVADELQKRGALANIPRTRLVDAVKQGLKEQVTGKIRPCDVVVGPGYERKGSGSTIPLTLNGRAMWLKTSVIEDDVRQILSIPRETASAAGASSRADLRIVKPTALEIKKGREMLEVNNPALALSSEMRELSNRDVFSFNGQGYPPGELVDYLTGLFLDPNIRPELSDVPRDTMAGAITTALKNSGAGGPDIYRAGAKKDILGLIPISVNGERMFFGLGLIEADVRKQLFGNPWRPRTDFISRVTARIMDVIFPVRLEGVRPVEYIPRADLPELALDERGELQTHDDLKDLLKIMVRREGLPNELWNNLLQNFGLNKFQRWTYTADYHELREGAGLAEYLTTAERLGWDHHQFPDITFKYIVTLQGQRPDLEPHKDDRPISSYNVRYFYDADGDRLLTMIIRREWLFDHIMNKYSEVKEAAKTVFMQGQSAELFRPDDTLAAARTFQEAEQDPLATLEGGTITPEEMARPAVDTSLLRVIAPREGIRTEDLIRMRRTALEAHRAAREAARKPRKR